ncbi:MAG: VWA domain-containing protein, partial [Bacteroidales bacterium]|nr:VWA domain-containing protein [Bacteroidales bacterium]
TSLTEATKIDAALNDLKNNIQGGGTSLSSALNTAIATLTASSGLYERMHIVLVTDGNISDYNACTTYAKTCRSRGITMSCMIFGEYGTKYLEQMADLCEIADGDGTVVYDETSYTNCKHIYNCSGSNRIADCIYNDIQSLVEEEINYQKIMISIDSSYRFSTLVDGLQYYEITTDDYGDEVVEYDTTHLYAYIERYYGTTIKSDASLILTGDYSVPLYAQWSYGEGMVGSYMGDLYHSVNDSGDETVTILSDVDGETSGITFIIRVVNGLLAAEDIRPTGIDATLTEDNYTNRITVYADVEDGWYVEGTIYDENGGEVLNLNEVTPGSEVTEETEFYVTTALTEGNGYARVDFVIKVPGIYTIVLSVKDSDGNVVRNDDGTYMTTMLYKITVYSAEYENYDAVDGLELMDSISTGTGYALTTMGELGLVFEGFVTEIIKDVNPTMALIIIALVLFLLAVAVRKFKWKWPHELVRERNERKQRQQAGGSR